MGLSGFQTNYRDLPGTPDIVFLKSKVVIFCDSDFWHGRKGLPVTNQEYWRKKLQRNTERDVLVNKMLQEDGWIVLRFSESEILKDSKECARRILEAVPTLE